MTNPNDIIRTRARTGGRASVYEANAWAQMLTSGLLDGSGVTQNTSADMNVIVGGSSTSPDVLIAENPSGYKIALDVVGQQTVAISAPTSNSRISAIVAYTDDLALSTDQDDVTGAPASCGLIVVNGTSAASPVDPDDETIRAAITADGATGSQASYVIIATVKVTSSTTAITNSLITINKAGVPARNIDFATFAKNITDQISIVSSVVTANNLVAYRYGNLVQIGGNIRIQGAVNLYDELVRITGVKALCPSQAGGNYVNLISINSASSANFIRVQWIAATQSNINQYMGINAMLVVEDVI